MFEERVKILNNIFVYFQAISQDLSFGLENVSKYVHNAQSLIEYLEVHDCGYIGGHDRENPVIRETNFDLYNRFTTLVRKYNNEEDIEKICYFDLDSMKEYFIIVNNLRESFNK